MNVMLPNWFLLLGSVGIVVWIIAGIAAYKAFQSLRSIGEQRQGGYNPFPKQALPNQDDADWWKREN